MAKQPKVLLNMLTADALWREASKRLIMHQPYRQYSLRFECVSDAVGAPLVLFTPRGGFGRIRYRTSTR